ncbi:dihydrofolate reductase family protein [Aureimonas jatrophae]|uniref:Pyrimidine reductase, riboflavin biosynthesis n=1 Tax=Aureimonas jatrophae TaxID=1166073 RepID=A0A1H0CM99_9HYPH|nr:dihydrofolate reductase family protein [Aureimonas jatrophae]MBB3949297.1 riboflavin biosynthesis pyrimidine reductase [Aureimonas jatrophae]SDN58985.1 Pyrimidine reductase, riboflavin biosynthesis [Aureimonas jatrophae]
MRPHTLCLMMTSIDGRVLTEGWAIDAPSEIFERAHDELGGDAWIVGRVTMEEDFDAAGDWERGLADGPIERADWFANREAGKFAIALDPHGRLNWKRDNIDGEHFVAIVGDEVSDDYLAFLRHRGVSYILGGRDGIDFSRVLDTLGRELGIRRLLVEGGGGLNGAILNAGLLDELLVFLLPLTDARPDAPSLFDAAGEWHGSRKLELLSHELRDGGILKLHYRVING